jgi:hypothetical protein
MIIASIHFLEKKKRKNAAPRAAPAGRQCTDSRLLSSLLSLSSLSISTPVPSLSPCCINYQHSSDHEKKENYAKSEARLKAVSGLSCKGRRINDCSNTLLAQLMLAVAEVTRSAPGWVDRYVAFPPVRSVYPPTLIKRREVRCSDPRLVCGRVLFPASQNEVRGLEFNEHDSLGEV